MHLNLNPNPNPNPNPNQAGLRRSDACTLLLPSLLGTASLPDPALAHRRAVTTLVTLVTLTLTLTLTPPSPIGAQSQP